VRRKPCEKDHTGRKIFAGNLESSLNSCSGVSSQGTLATSSVERRDETYLDVFTIAKRCAPFANCNETLVSLALIGVKLLMRPVIPVLLVVNRSPIW